MVIGNIVKRKDKDQYGVVRFSRHSNNDFCILFWDETTQTLSATVSALDKYWEIVNTLPKEYEWNEYGLPVKMIK